MSTKESKTVSKFEKKISDSDDSIRGARGAIVAKTAKRAAENKVRSIEDMIDMLETTILNLTDLAPDTTYSLRPGGKDFDPEGWVDKLHEATLDLEMKKIELSVAESIIKEWF